MSSLHKFDFEGIVLSSAVIIREGNKNSSKHMTFQAYLSINMKENQMKGNEPFLVLWQNSSGFFVN